MNTTTTDTTHGTKLALDIIEEGKRPMSIDEIKAKCRLTYPFEVVLAVTVSPGDYPNSSRLFRPREEVTPAGTVRRITGYEGDGFYIMEDAYTPGDWKVWMFKEGSGPSEFSRT